MEAILSLSMAPRHAHRLLLSATIGTTLLLLAACSSDAPAAPNIDTAADATLVAEASTGDTVDSIADSQTDSQADSTSSGDANQDSSTTADTVPPAEQYLADANMLLHAVTTTSDSVATQLENADVESAVWRTRTADVLRELSVLLDSAQDLAAPPEYTAQHQALIDATGKYSWATAMLADGVETLDLNTISDAAALLANASLELATAQAALVG